jgi:hypothetical protein
MSKLLVVIAAAGTLLGVRFAGRRAALSIAEDEF